MSLSKTHSAGISGDSAHHRLHLLKPKRRYQRLYTEGPVSDYKDLQSAKKPPALFLNRKQKSKSQTKQYGFVGSGMEPEVVVEENLNLKKFINELQTQLTEQTRRLEKSKKKTSKMNRKLNREFEKEMYYSGKTPNMYLVSGVKLQYQKAQELYQEKCQELEDLQREPAVTDFEEMQTYIAVLEEENRILKEKVESVEAKREANSRASRKSSAKFRKGRVYRSDVTGDVPKEGEEEAPSAEKLSKMLSQQKLNVQSAHRLIERYSQKCKLYDKQLNESLKKIGFLEKLLIQKDNSEHKARKECNKVTRELEGLHRQRKQEQLDLTQNNRELEIKMSKIQEREERRAQEERNTFEKALEDKDLEIKKLQKEIRYLSNLLTYWKPLDGMNREISFEASQIRQDQPILIISSQDQGLEQRGRLSNIRDKTASMNSDLPVLQGIDLIASVELENNRSHRTSVLFDKSESIMKNNSEARSHSQYNVVVTKSHPPIWCGKKNRQKAVKRRKVDINNIRYLGELMRYRVIGERVSIEEVKGLLEAQEEYVSMAQVKSILMDKPFCLGEQEAAQISRYVVEDCDGEWVYEDEQNQIQRSIAKSILKAFIGEYNLGEQAQLHKEWDEILAHYGHNLHSVYTTIAPSGIIALTRFLQILKGLGIELADDLQDWVVGRMAVGSSSLQSLKYGLVITE